MAFTNIHLPCENCGSSDAKAVNDNGSTICFSCNHFTRGDGQMQAVELTEDVCTKT
jgi:hypothetical protein